MATIPAAAMNLHFPSYGDARRLAREGNLVPLVATMPADLDTPVGVYLTVLPTLPDQVRRSADSKPSQKAGTSSAAILHKEVPAERSGSPVHDSKAIQAPSGDHEGAPS